MTLRGGGVYLFGSETAPTPALGGGEAGIADPWQRSSPGPAMCSAADPADGGAHAMCSAALGFGGAWSGAFGIATGPVPEALRDPQIQALCQGPGGAGQCADSLIYAARRGVSYFSPDAGRQWFALVPACRLDIPVSFAALAADRGQPGHVVALASSADGSQQREASGCERYSPSPVGPCALRTIAWTSDIGPEHRESMLAAQPGGSDPGWLRRMRLERAGGGGPGADPRLVPATPGGYSSVDARAWTERAKWRYATINNLPAPARDGGRCAIRVGAYSADHEGSVVGPECRAAESHHCHGRKSTTYRDPAAPAEPADRDAWCLDAASAACQCLNGRPSDCRYPLARHLEIDPRNGWAYLSTDVGLLASPDGGGHWIREGAGPNSNPADAMPDGPNRGATGAQLLIARDGASAQGQRAPSRQTYDLNKASARVRAIGRINLAFTPCHGGAAAPRYADTARVRGHLLASVAVEWTAQDGNAVSGVLTASERANCDPSVAVPAPGALVFRESP